MPPLVEFPGRALAELCRRLPIRTSGWTMAATDELRAVVVPRRRRDGRWNVSVRIQPQSADVRPDLFGQIVTLEGHPEVRAAVETGGRVDLGPVEEGEHHLLATQRWRTSWSPQRLTMAAAEADTGSAPTPQPSTVEVAGLTITQSFAYPLTILRVQTDRQELGGARLRLLFVPRGTEEPAEALELQLEAGFTDPASALPRWGQEWSGRLDVGDECRLVVEIPVTGDGAAASAPGGELQ